MATITLLNQKGGVGKTSTCHHLAGTLAQLGRRVLLVDNDPQSSLTQGLWGPSVALGVDPAETIAAVYAGEAVADRIIKPSGIPGVDLVPGSVRSTRHNVPVPYEADWDAQTCLRSFLEEIRGRYHLTLIDCPPNLHLCSWAALVASDYLIVPLQPEDYGRRGSPRCKTPWCASCPGPTRASASSATSSRWSRPGGRFTSSMRPSFGRLRGRRLRGPGPRGHGVRRSRRSPDADRAVQAEGRRG